jgi:hypothetical protein
MKRILIFTLLLSLGISVFAQEYYYWYRNEKQLLELDPTRKYISVRSTDDTLALKTDWQSKIFICLILWYIVLGRIIIFVAQ